MYFLFLFPIAAYSDTSFAIYVLNTAGRTPLHLAACRGNAGVMKCLLDAPGANINCVDRWSRTPLEDALASSAQKVSSHVHTRHPFGRQKAVHRSHCIVSVGREAHPSERRCRREPIHRPCFVQGCSRRSGGDAHSAERDRSGLEHSRLRRADCAAPRRLRGPCERGEC
jgi:hypothetical protein